ncbi:MAG TPA: hypothetical protein VN695_04890 [Streptosporangiaceae bacterium]|nr:hypothetical protein [Streptosporangiaceae bacterium]
MRRKAGVLIAGVLAAGVLTAGGLVAGEAAASTGLVTASKTPTGPVLAHPVTTTPHFAPNDSPYQQIRQIVQCKGTMFAVGTFTTIKQGGKSYVRHDVMSFSAKPPYTITSWAPTINGTVNSITFSGGICADAYIGGAFKAVNTTALHNIAEISTSTGHVIKTFAHSASAAVNTLLAITAPGGARHILVGGDYRSINGSSADPYMTSLNPATGKDDRYLDLRIHGNYEFPGVVANPTKVFNQALSHSGKLDLVMGDFTSVGTVPRQQIFMLTFGPKHGRVTGWTSPEFDGSDGNLPGGYPYQCYTDVAFYVRAAAWSPDDSTIYLADTGYHPWNLTASGPRTGLCDSASAWPATQTKVLHRWINYTGCDSLFSVAADSSTVYFAGHERWSENPDGCDQAGAGAISAPGIEGLSPSTGLLTFNPTRDRGIGADDMIITSEGLWIASDNWDNSNMCGKVKDLAGICLLPYRS